MASPKFNTPLLQDLALIYMALAHGADQHLADAERAVMLARLRSWQQDLPEEALEQAIEAALAAHLADADDAHLEQAIQHVRDSLSVRVRRALLDDLMEIALADARFMYRESDFIGRLARAWEVHDTEVDVSPQWNVLRQQVQAGQWTPVHDLALLFLTVAHRPDTTLAEAEMAAIRKKIKEWLPAATSADVSLIVMEALKVYAEAPEGQAVDRAITAVRRHLPYHQRGALLADFHYIAAADGVTLVEEKTLIAQLAQALELPYDG